MIRQSFDTVEKKPKTNGVPELVTRVRAVPRGYAACVIDVSSVRWPHASASCICAYMYHEPPVAQRCDAATEEAV